jgi:hypothetical protein
VLEGDAGVIFTADSMDVRTFRGAVSAIRGVLSDE